MQEKKLTTEQLALVDSCMDLAYSMANKYADKNPTMDRGDLEQEALLGLVQASTRYDKSKGTKFTTYCYPWIMKFILAYIERNISRGFKPEKKRIEEFLYQRMTDDESEDFIMTFIRICGFDHPSRMGEGTSPSDGQGEPDRYEFVEDDWLRSVASAADRILEGNEKAVFTEVLACIAEGSDEPIEDAAANVRMESGNVEAICRVAIVRVIDGRELP